jgi:hypothetical protein
MLSTGGDQRSQGGARALAGSEEECDDGWAPASEHQDDDVFAAKKGPGKQHRRRLSEERRRVQSEGRVVAGAAVRYAAPAQRAGLSKKQLKRACRVILKLCTKVLQDAVLPTMIDIDTHQHLGNQRTTTAR